MDAPGDDGAGTLDSGPTPHQVGAPCALRSPPVRKRPSAPDVDEEMVTKRSAGQPNSRAGDTEARPFDMGTNTEAAAAVRSNRVAPVCTAVHGLEETGIHGSQRWWLRQ